MRTSWTGGRNTRLMMDVPSDSCLSDLFGFSGTWVPRYSWWGSQKRKKYICGVGTSSWNWHTWRACRHHRNTVDACALYNSWWTCHRQFLSLWTWWALETCHTLPWRIVDHFYGRVCTVFLKTWWLYPDDGDLSKNPPKITILELVNQTGFCEQTVPQCCLMMCRVTSEFWPCKTRDEFNWS